MSEQPTPDDQGAQFNAEAAQAAQRVVDGEYSAPSKDQIQSARVSLDHDYKKYTEGYNLAASKDELAVNNDAGAAEYHDLAARADELVTDPEWVGKGRIGEGKTAEDLRERLERRAAMEEDEARYARKSAKDERYLAENLIQKRAKEQYEQTPNAFYHAAVADAHMNGVHINTGARPSHATDVQPIQPTVLPEQPPQDAA